MYLKTISKIFSVIGLLTLVSQIAVAIDEGEFRAGIMGGHVGLIGDVGGDGRNALGVGALVGYAFTDEMFFNIGYMGSTHESVKHRDISVGVDFYFNSYDLAYLYGAGGVSFLHNDIDPPTGATTGASADAFGLYLGAGADFELGTALLAGLQFRYQKAFEAESTINISGVPTKTKVVQDSVTVMLRALFRFGAAD